MRLRKKNANVSVHAIAGSHVVLFGLDADEATASKLLGFQILRTGPGDKTPTPLESGHEFAGVDSDVPVIQSFIWGDYRAEPNTTYTYRIVPVTGTPAKQKLGKAVEITVTTEDPAAESHAVYFNRGVHRGASPTADASVTTDGSTRRTRTRPTRGGSSTTSSSAPRTCRTVQPTCGCPVASRRR